MAKMSQENMIFGCSLMCLAGLFTVACSFVNINLLTIVLAFVNGVSWVGVAILYL